MFNIFDIILYKNLGSQIIGLDSLGIPYFDPFEPYIYSSLDPYFFSPKSYSSVPFFAPLLPFLSAAVVLLATFPAKNPERTA